MTNNAEFTYNELVSLEVAARNQVEDYNDMLASLSLPKSDSNKLMETIRFTESAITKLGMIISDIEG